MDFLELDRIIREVGKDGVINNKIFEITLDDYLEFVEDGKVQYNYVNIEHGLNSKNLIVTMIESGTGEELNVPTVSIDENNIMVKTLFPKQGTLIVRK